MKIIVLNVENLIHNIILVTYGYSHVYDNPPLFFQYNENIKMLIYSRGKNTEKRVSWDSP